MTCIGSPPPHSGGCVSACRKLWLYSYSASQAHAYEAFHRPAELLRPSRPAHSVEWLAGGCVGEHAEPGTDIQWHRACQHCLRQGQHRRQEPTEQARVSLCWRCRTIQNTQDTASKQTQQQVALQATAVPLQHKTRAVLEVQSRMSRHYTSLGRTQAGQHVLCHLTRCFQHNTLV